MRTRPGNALHEAGAPGARDLRRLRGFVLVLALLIPLAVSPAAPQGTRATTAPEVAAPREAVPGVKNFGRVTPQLYRGAQPTDDGFHQLQKMGVRIIVDFREGSGEIERERKAASAEHMKFVSIPWSAWKDPTAAQVKEFFGVLTANPDGKVFVHCHKGADRTGTMVALYRIAAQKWSASNAIEEMKAYHLHAFWFAHLERYVENFPQQLAADSSLRGALAAPQPGAP